MYTRSRLPFYLAGVLIVAAGVSAVAATSFSGTGTDSELTPELAEAERYGGIPEPARAAFLRGQDLERRARPRAAIDAYREAVSLHPEFVEAHLGYVEVMWSLYRQAEVRHEYRDLRDERPNSAVFQFLYAFALSRVNTNPRVLEAEYLRAVELDPSLPWPYAYVYSEHPSWEIDEGFDTLSAFAQPYEKCTDLAPWLSVCHEEQVRRHLRMNRPDLAIPVLDRLLSRPSDSRHRPWAHAELIGQRLPDRPGVAAALIERALAEFDASTRPWSRYGFLTHLFKVLRDPAEGLSGDADSLAAHYRAWIPSELERVVELTDSDLLTLHFQTHPYSPTEAAKHVREARALRGARAADLKGWEAELQLRLCWSLRYAGQAAAASDACSRAIDLHRTSGDSLKLRNSLHGGTHAHEELGDLRAALTFAETYLAVSRPTVAPSGLLSPQHDVGWIAWKLGFEDRARAALEEVAAIVDEAGRWEYEAGEFYEALGDYDRAVDYYVRGVEEANTHDRRSEWGSYGRGLYKLSSLYLKLGDPQRALAYAEPYDRWAKRQPAEFVPLPNLPDVLLATGRHDKALESATDWLRRAGREAAPDHLTAARRQIALILLERGRVNEAIPRLEAVFDDFEDRHQDREATETALILVEAYRNVGESARASALLSRIAENLGRTPEPTWPWRVEFLEGRLREDAGDSAAALAAYEAAIDQLESLRGQVPGADLRSRFFAGRLDVYEAAIELLVVAGIGPDVAGVRRETTRGDMRHRLDRAFHLVQQKKARTLLDRLASTRSDAAAGLATRLLRRETELESRLAVARGRLANPETDVAAIRANIAALEREYAQVQHEIWQDSPLGAALGGRAEPVGLDELQEKMLGADEAMISYSFVDQKLLAFVVSSRLAVVHVLPLTRSELLTRIEQLSEPMAALARGDVSLAQIDWDLDEASALYDALVRPLEPDLRGARTLRIVPEDELWLVPFDALVRNATASSWRSSEVSPGRLFDHYENVEYLIDRFAVALLPTPVLLRSELWPDRDPSRGVVAFGGVVGSGGPVLDESEAEVRGIERHAKDAHVLTGSAATEAAFYAEAPGSGILHLATHGVVDPHRPALSGLRLAPSPGDEDGLLQAFEIAQTPLSADLVILSACATGAGELRRGEGVLSLSRAFMAAGVPSVIASMWTLPDAAGRMMPHLYGRVAAGAGYAEALRSAKLQVLSGYVTLEDGTEVATAHPLFWASLVLIGSPGE